MKVGEVRTVVPFEFETEEYNILKRAEEIIREMCELLNSGELDHFEDENDGANAWDAYDLAEVADKLEMIRDLNLANADA